MFRSVCSPPPFPETQRSITPRTLKKTWTAHQTLPSPPPAAHPLALPPPRPTLLLQRPVVFVCILQCEPVKESGHPRGMPLVARLPAFQEEQRWETQWHSSSVNSAEIRAPYRRLLLHFHRASAAFGGWVAYQCEWKGNVSMGGGGHDCQCGGSGESKGNVSNWMARVAARHDASACAPWWVEDRSTYSLTPKMPRGENC
jgi:hypothetical protein